LVKTARPRFPIFLPSYIFFFSPKSLAYFLRVGRGRFFPLGNKLKRGFFPPPVRSPLDENSFVGSSFRRSPEVFWNPPPPTRLWILFFSQPSSSLSILVSSFSRLMPFWFLNLSESPAARQLGWSLFRINFPRDCFFFRFPFFCNFFKFTEILVKLAFIPLRGLVLCFSPWSSSCLPRWKTCLSCVFWYVFPPSCHFWSIPGCMTF